MAGTGTETDPVCGMTVTTRTAEYRSFRGDQTYYFCSAGCRSTFESNPAQYLAPARALVGHAMHGGDQMESNGTAIDPVCGMTVDKQTAEYRSFRGGETYYFCSAGCKQTFDKDPEKYMTGGKGGHHAH